MNQNRRSSKTLLESLLNKGKKNQLLADLVKKTAVTSS